MAFTYEQLKEKTVAELREIAAEIKHEAVQGYTQLNKEHLLAALCKALNIDMHVHKKVKATALDKGKVKSQMKELKKKRDAALEAHDHAQLKTLRHQMHELRRLLRKAAAIAPK
ncbi:MAG: Rho termination factor N-terminal domain-containing protein [Acidobacteriia bacterium]|nr:Rho termination factor N-terminal domain-containing protein [Terriglobia bacterium]